MIDLHLDSVDQAKIWNIPAFRESAQIEGHEPYELRIGKFDFRKFSGKYLRSPPDESDAEADDRVFQRGKQVIVKPGDYPFGIGLTFGTVYVDCIEGEGYREWTVVGESVNLDG